MESVASIENLLAAWNEFAVGKRKKPDVQEFSVSLMDNILSLRRDLLNRTYRHGSYYAFSINDPKPRNIHKASVRDRLLHHALHRLLYPFFNRTFIADSFSCRKGKGTHAALNRFREISHRTSHNHTRTCWALKCDVRKFFASVDQATLMGVVRGYIPDQGIQWLIAEAVSSFFSTALGKGLPLGNLTSQLLVNVYMNELDQYVKHRLKARYYIRYTDDFVVLSHDLAWLEGLVPQIHKFLDERLKLRLHPQKVSIATVASGVDFLGWVHFSNHRVLRTATKRRMLRRLRESPTKETINSYLGLFQHGNTRRLRTEVIDAAYPQ